MLTRMRFTMWTLTHFLLVWYAHLNLWMQTHLQFNMRMLAHLLFLWLNNTFKHVCLSPGMLTRLQFLVRMLIDLTARTGT